MVWICMNSYRSTITTGNCLGMNYKGTLEYVHLSQWWRHDRCVAPLSQDSLESYIICSPPFSVVIGRAVVSSGLASMRWQNFGGKSLVGSIVFTSSQWFHYFRCFPLVTGEWTIGCKGITIVSVGRNEQHGTSFTSLDPDTVVESGSLLTTQILSWPRLMWLLGMALWDCWNVEPHLICRVIRLAMHLTTISFPNIAPCPLERICRYTLKLLQGWSIRGHGGGLGVRTCHI